MISSQKYKCPQAKKKNRGSFGDRSKIMGSSVRVYFLQTKDFWNIDIKLTTGQILASVILTNQSLGKMIKMMGFWVTKSEIGGL